MVRLSGATHRLGPGKCEDVDGSLKCEWILVMMYREEIRNLSRDLAITCHYEKRRGGILFPIWLRNQSFDKSWKKWNVVVYLFVYWGSRAPRLRRSFGAHAEITRRRNVKYRWVAVLTTLSRRQPPWSWANGCPPWIRRGCRKQDAAGPLCLLVFVAFKFIPRSWFLGSVSRDDWLGPGKCEDVYGPLNGE